MANNIVQINSNNGINVTTQTSNDIISVVALGPQGPQGPQGEPGDGFPFNGGVAQVTGSLQVTGSTILTGSLKVSEGITGSLQGTASWAQNSVTASYALNASGIDTSSLVTTSSFNSFTSSIQSFTQSIQSSVNSLTNATSSYLLRSETSSLTQLSTFNNFTSSYNTGSFTGSFTGSLLGTASKVIIGDLGTNVYPIAIASPSGDILKVDGFTLNGSTKFLNLPNDYYLYMPEASTINASTFLGNLTGTASFATSASRALNSNSASFATTASYVLNAISASYIQNAQSASYVLNAISSSFTTTASYALNGGVTQIVAGTNITISPVGGTGAVTINSSGGGGATFPYTGSALITGSLTITGSTTSTLGFTGSLLGTASRAVSSSYALTASYALSSAGGGGGTSLGSIFITLYDGGSNLTTGIKDTPAYIPYDGTATGWEMLAYNSSNVLMTASCVVDILQGRFIALPLSGSNSMVGSEKPTLTNQSSSFSSSLSTWTSITAGDYVQAEIESISGNVAKIVIAIKTTKSS
jgi:hypothetical protein